MLLTLGIGEDDLPLEMESLHIEPTWAIWAFSVYEPLIYCNTFNTVDMGETCEHLLPIRSLIYFRSLFIYYPMVLF
jgi:hypothetical protein